MNRAILFLLLFSFLFIISCGRNGNPTGPDTQDPWTLTYSISGDTIVFVSPQRIDSNYYCDSGDSVVIRFDTVYTGSLDTMLIVNDSILMWHGDTFLHRIGTGNGIQGRWIVATDTLLYGYPYYGITYQIGPNTAKVSFSEADKFIMFPWILRNPQPDISITKSSYYTIFLTGNITSEVVTITWNEAGDETYASNNPQHKQKVWFRKPISCPNDRPDWYYQFITANTH